MVNDNIDNLVLEQLRLLRNDVQSFRADLLAELVEIKNRLRSLEAGQATIRRDLLGVVDDQVSHQAALDRLAQRLERVERRLELLP